jgi:polyphosphate kinase
MIVPVAAKAPRNPPSARDPSERAARLFNRELSWLDFDQRVLEVAADSQLPLLERVRLCGIVGSNLDEFYAVRVAGLLTQIESAVRRRSPDGRTPARTLADVRARARELQEAHEALWLEELRPALAEEGIRILPVLECSGRELRSLTKRFKREVQPLLTPIAVGAGAPFPLVPSLALNIGVLAADGAKTAPRFIRVNVPDDLPRFLEVGSNGARVPIEDAILHFLPTVVAGGHIGRTVFRVTRDADFSVSGDADDLLEAVETQLLRRRFGDVVRLEVAQDAPPLLVDRLVHQLRLTTAQVRSASVISASCSTSTVPT